MLARSVVSGALASVGIGALLSPVLSVVVTVACLLALIDRILGAPTTPFELLFVLVPWLIAVAVWSMVGGYVAAEMTKHELARHGAAAALLGLVVMLAYGLLVPIGAGLLGVTLAVGAIAAIPVAMLFGRLGAVLAPRAVSVIPRRDERPALAAPSPRLVRRPLAVAGLKGGARMDDRAE